MGKFLILVFLVVLLYRVFTRTKRVRRPPRVPAAPQVEAMIQCAHCGVHVPLGESVAEGERRYCCEEHRRLGRK